MSGEAACALTMAKRRKKKRSKFFSFFLSHSFSPPSLTSAYHMTSGQGKNMIDPKMESGCEREDMVSFGGLV